MDEKYYTSLIEQTFDKMESTPRRPLKAVEQPSKSWKIGMYAASTVGFIASLSVALLNSGEPGIVAPAAMAVSATFMCSAVLGDDFFDGAVQAMLVMCGRSLPLTSQQADRLSTWSTSRPELVNILGKWAATNKDGVLNRRDFNDLKKSLKKVEKIENRVRDLSKINQSLSSAGITSSTKRHQLAKVANHGGDGPTPPKPVI